MFSVYFPVCLRAIIARLVPDRDKGKWSIWVSFRAARSNALSIFRQSIQLRCVHSESRCDHWHHCLCRDLPCIARLVHWSCFHRCRGHSHCRTDTDHVILTLSRRTTAASFVLCSIQALCIDRRPQLSLTTSGDEIEDAIVEVESNDGDDDEIIRAWETNASEWIESRNRRSLGALYVPCTHRLFHFGNFRFNDLSSGQTLASISHYQWCSSRCTHRP